MTGRGVTGTVGGVRVALGNRLLMEDLGVRLDDLPTEADRLRAEGDTVIFVAIYGRAAGLLLSPIIAAAAMSFSSVSVIGNALRLRRLPM